MSSVMRLRGCMAGLMLASVCAAASAADSVRVSVSGRVHRAATFELPAQARFSDALLAAMPEEHAYLLGAAVLRRQAIEQQVRLKAGVLYDLGLVAGHEDLPQDLRRTATALRALVEAMPVTGRVSSPLEPRRLEIDPAANEVLADGDSFVFPVRPQTIRVVGAVRQPCELEHVPLREAVRYLRACPRDKAASPDLIHVVQPDGQVQIAGIALWNRDAGHVLAPGALIYVPLDERRIRTLAPRLNQELAAFIATQPLAVGIEE